MRAASRGGRWRLAILAACGWLSATGAGAVAAGNCLDTVRTATPMRLTLGGQSVPVGIWDFDWPSAWVVNHILQILLREVMGYDAVFTGNASSAEAESVFALAGCLRPDRYSTNPMCDEGTRDHRHHIAMEVWLSPTGEIWEDHMNKELMPSRLVELDTMGYSGFETIFTPASAWHAAWEAEGLPLDWYRSFNSSWHHPSRYFANLTDIPLNDLKTCDQSLLAGHSMIAQYLKNTGDHDGVVSDGDGLVARCWNGSWWLAPSCRLNPDTCIPVITGGDGWLLSLAMQAATAWNMPWALAVASSFSTYQSIPNEHVVLMYWWTPDTSFIDKAPKQIIFEAPERTPWWTFGKRSGIDLRKLASKELANLAPDITYVVRNFVLSPSQLGDMLLDLKVNNVTPEEAACKWLRENEDTWRGWIPKGEICVPGMGFAYQWNDDFFPVERVQNVTEAHRCQWCPPGRYSLHLGKSPLGGGQELFACALCEAGTYAHQLGQTQCVKCLRGQQSGSEGATRCDACDLGRYQALEGSSACDACPPERTTVLPGGEDSTACVCPEGTYAVAATAGANASVRCAQCPEGMICAAGAEEENVPCGAAQGTASSATQSQRSPMPAKGYWVGCDAPLVPFRCIDAQECPGQTPQQCRDKNREGIACGRCANGFVESWFNRFSCLECKMTEAETAFWVLFIMVIVVTMILVLHRFAANDSADWHRPQVALLSLGYVGLVFLQILAIYASTDIVLPDTSSISVFISYTLRDLDRVVEHMCMFSGLHRNARMWWQLTAPLQLMSVFFLVYTVVNATTSSLRIAKRMEPNVGISNFGSLFLTFFISIARQAFTMLHCYKHPGRAGWSLHDAPDILCYKDEWISMMAPTVVAVVIGLGGSLSLFCFVVRLAPRHSHDVNFRRRWQFLFMRFRPSAWWWSLVLMMRGIVCSAGSMLLSDGLHQLIWLQTVMLIYAVWCAGAQPWNGPGVTVADVLVAVSMLCVGSVFAGFARLDIVGDWNDGDVTMAVFFGMPFLSVLLVGATVVAQSRGRRPADKHYQDLGNNLAEICAAIDPDELADVLQRLPWVDLLQVHQGVSILHQEVSLKRRLLLKRGSRRSGAMAACSTTSDPGDERGTAWSEDETGHRVPWELAFGYKLSLRSRLVFFESARSAGASTKVFPTLRSMSDAGGPTMPAGVPPPLPALTLPNQGWLAAGASPSPRGDLNR